MVAVAPFLSERERVLVQTRAHTVVLWGAFALAVGAVALMAAAVAVLGGRGGLGRVGTVGVAGAALLVAVAVVRLALRVWEWDRTVLAVTDEQVLVVRGLLRRQTHSVPLASVERLRVRQGAAGRLLGYGTIVLENELRRSRLAYVPQAERVSALIAGRVGRRDSAVST